MSWGLVVAGVGTLAKAGSSYIAGRDAKKANEKQAEISIADAMHRQEVAKYNADIIRDQATRLRNEQVARLSESAGINIGRITEDMDINIGRLSGAYDTNVLRLINSGVNQIKRTNEDSLIESARVQEVADTTVRRLERDATEVVNIGSQEENSIRRIAAESISSTRAFYGARNVVIDSGTPAALQVDAARMGEVEALRMRRNYRLKAEAILEKASDIKRDATWQIGDINRVSAYQISDIRNTTGQQIQDFTRDLGYNLSDIQRTSGQQLADLQRNLGYDLSDTEFEALKLDQQAALTILSGNAELSAGLNRSEAYKKAGSNAMTQGILGAVGAVIPQIDPKWLSSNSTGAPVYDSQPSYVRA